MLKVLLVGAGGVVLAGAVVLGGLAALVLMMDADEAANYNEDNVGWWSP